jgi:acyl-CoA dehydrogenase
VIVEEGLRTHLKIDYKNLKNGNDVNWYSDDALLTRYTARYLSQPILSYVEHSLIRAGELSAGPIDRRAVHTDRDGSPKLVRYDKKGKEINQVWHNEGYIQTMKEGYGTGVVAYRYDKNSPEKMPFFVNALLIYLLSEAESGFTCPVGLSQSVAFVLEKFGSEQQKKTYLTKLASFDPNEHVEGATFLTEIQGGSDVGATETVAVKEGDHYLLTGEKWFASNCDAEVAVTLARVNDLPSTKGLGLFLVPRTLQDGSQNSITVRRLKDKLGVRAVASGELVFNQTVGYLIGEAEYGFKYMAEALNVSRMGTALCGTAIAQRSFLEAAIYASHREAFGSPINQFPMVRETLVNMVTQIEAAWAILAQTLILFDRVHTYNEGDEEDTAIFRILLSLSKFRCSELGVSAAKDALEIHGGNGYIEDYVTPRLLRDAIVNPVWEGTANIQSLEVLKILNKTKGKALIEKIRQTLNSIHHLLLQENKVVISAEVDRLEELIHHTREQDSYTQEGLAKKLASFCYDVFAAVHLLEEAQYDLLHDNNDRRLLIFNQWIKLSFDTSKDKGILNNQVITQEIFEAIVG